MAIRFCHPCVGIQEEIWQHENHSRRCAWPTLPQSLALVILVAIGSMAQNQGPPSHTDKSSMHQHYDAAYRFQSSGDLARADVEHIRFLADALNHLANLYANTGDYAHAAPLYDEALNMAPSDFGLLMDFSGAALDAHDPTKAKSLLQRTMDVDAKGTTEHQKAEVRRLFGQTLRALGDTNAAIEQFRAAIAIDPNIDNLCDLADALLEIDGPKGAAPIFARVITRFGDTAAVRMRIGRVYALSGLPDQAIEEFKKAVEKNSNMPGAHYSLGAAYMSNSAKDLPRAEAEFRKELALHPNDTFSYPQLGEIALRRRDFYEAEVDYKRAIALNPLDADNFAQLGKLYMDTGRSSDAESSFRKAISLTVDPARNNYAIERTHYRLGRLLMANGDAAEGERELQISQELLTKSDIQSGSKLSGEQVQKNPLDRTRVATPAEAEELKSFSQRIGPLIAASYNNLGVHSAINKEFSRASKYFELAAKWNPTLAGVDSNWGRAAFAAHECIEAIGPLHRALDAHPSDADLHAMLDQCEGASTTAPTP